MQRNSSAFFWIILVVVGISGALLGLTGLYRSIAPDWVMWALGILLAAAIAYALLNRERRGSQDQDKI